MYQMDSQFSQHVASFLNSFLQTCAKYIKANPNLVHNQEHEIVELLRQAYALPMTTPRVGPVAPNIAGLIPATAPAAIAAPYPMVAPHAAPAAKKGGRTGEKQAAVSKQRNISRDTFFAEIKQNQDMRNQGQQAPFLCAYQAPRNNPNSNVCAGPATFGIDSSDFQTHRCLACNGKMGNISKQPKGATGKSVYGAINGAVVNGFNLPNVGVARPVGVGVPHAVGAAVPPPPVETTAPGQFKAMSNGTLKKGYYLAKQPEINHFLIRGDPLTCIGKFAFVCNKETQFPSNYEELVQPLTDEEIAFIKPMGCEYSYKKWIEASGTTEVTNLPVGGTGSSGVPVPIMPNPAGIVAPAVYSIPQPNYNNPLPQAHSIPVPVPQAHSIPVPQPIQVPVPQAHAVPVPVPQAHSIPVPQPIQVPVPQAHAVPVPQPIQVPVPQAHAVPVPQPIQVPVPVPQPTTSPSLSVNPPVEIPHPVSNAEILTISN
jgi:hypothetical protein